MLSACERYEPVALSSTEELATETAAEAVVESSEAIEETEPVETAPPEPEDTRERTVAKGIYLAYAPVNNESFMDEIISVMDETELNAVVIDVKDDYGRITYDMQGVPLVDEIGASSGAIEDLPAIIAELKAHDIYCIARVVALKDPFIAEAKPEWALYKGDGSIFRDNAGDAWVNPYKTEYWDYLLDVSRAAGEIGFDEIQFDYIRFCTERGVGDVVYDEADTLGRDTELCITQLEKATGIRNLLPVINRLLERGALSIKEELKRSYKPRTEAFIRLAETVKSEDDLHRLFDALSRAPKQLAALMKYVELSGWVRPGCFLKEVPRKTLLQEANVASTIVSGLVEKHIFELYHQEVGRLARLVQNMLDITKLEAGEVPVHARNYDLWKTVTDVVLSDEQRIEDGRIDIQGLGGPPLAIYADPDFVHQVVYNIVDNAIKFTPEGGTISFAAQKKGNMVEVRIENTGAGIAPEALPFVFERFYKEDRSRGMNTRGSGLGLHICKILINLSGGQIHAESEEGKWCRFVFTLPAGK